MRKIFLTSGKRPDDALLHEIQAYYVSSAPVDLARLPAATDAGKLEFRNEAFGGLKREISRVTNVNVANVDGDGRPEVLVCDELLKSVSILRLGTSGWTEEAIASCEAPVQTAVFDADADGDTDIAVAGLGSMQENEGLVGYVLLLVNNREKGWEKRELAKGLPRVTDVQPADVDGDGDRDLIVGAFGGGRRGSIGWLRNDGAKWEHVIIADRSGAIHVPVADFDGDGRPDFVALVAQESESVMLYMNKGGKFEAKTIFEARNPLFGSSGLQLTDLDLDGDLDVLFTNGDALSDPCAMPWPYHGVQWLENQGKLEFAYHDIGRCYGPFRAVATDLDGDGDMDVAAGILFGMWADSGETGLIWYENDGKMKFTRHDIPSPTRFITLAAGDLDGDGVPELVTGQMSFLGSSEGHDHALLKWSSTKKK
ncbi:MAG: VCBS repeat-containing protein [Planctomycetota bacterium]